GRDDHPGGDGPARPNERACPRPQAHECPGTRDGWTEVDRWPIDGAPVEPAGALVSVGTLAPDGGHVDRRQAQAGQRADDLVPVDLGQVELRQADLLDGELRHLTSSSGSDRGRSRIRPDPVTRTRKVPT